LYEVLVIDEGGLGGEEEEEGLGGGCVEGFGGDVEFGEVEGGGRVVVGLELFCCVGFLWGRVADAEGTHCFWGCFWN
jgi:hypothetical protein